MTNRPESSGDLSGRRLGVYSIEARIGAGGMGEVYRARDTKLGRDVAIKVLPPHLTADPDRRARLAREARLLATLNHPHIAQIYGLEESDGVQALVMELVSGETLADIIAGAGPSARGARTPSDKVRSPTGLAPDSARARPLDFRRALEIARHVADALDAAHEKGIVHRDLKPGNIMIEADAAAKVLDFGLAKATAGDIPGADLSQLPTVTGDGTWEGAILGTPAYMSPEQARGQAVDKRTDIWAFGCVLFEMLTGRGAFARDTLSDTIAAVIERDPDWNALPAAVPPAVRRLLTRCLEKDPKRRLHDIADARTEIDDVLSGASLAPAEAVAVDRRSVRLPWAIAAIASLVALVAVGALTWYARRAPQTQTTPPRVSRLTMASSGTAAVWTANGRSLAITPDGTRVVYVGNNGTQLFVRPLDQTDPTPIFTGSTPLTWVFVSPDGQWVGFGEGLRIRKVALTGGPARDIAGPAGLGATWAPDGTIIFGSSDPSTGLQRVSDNGGAVTVLTRPTAARGESDHVWPEMLPGGRAVLFTITAITGGLDAAQVAVLDLTTDASTILVPGGSHAHYVSSGHLVYVAGGTLRAVPFDLDGLKTHGASVTVVPRLATTRDGSGEFDVSPDGTLAYVDAPDSTAAAARTLVWVDRQGREDPLGTQPRPYLHPSLSPDGTRVAVAIEDQGHDLWIWDLARKAFSQVTFTPFPTRERAPVWTADGNRLIFFTPAGGDAPSVFWKPADGSGATETLGAGGGPPSGVTPDGRVIVGAQDLTTVTLDGKPRMQALVKTPSSERNGVVSPNGRWLAYESNSSGRFEIYVAPFPNAATRQWLASDGGGTRPLWARDGQELFYVAANGAIMAVRVDSRGDTWAAGSPAKVVEGPYVTAGGTARTYDVSPDGQRFLMVKQAPSAQAAAPQIVVVQNWLEEVRRVAPR